MKAAEAEARKNNWNVVICVVDDGANLMYLQKMDGTQIGSVDIAQMKARTAIKMKRPSKVLEDAVAGGRNAVLKLPDVLPVEGGVPLVIDGRNLYRSETMQEHGFTYASVGRATVRPTGR